MRVALVGAGTMGTLHARVASQTPTVELACIVDPDKQRGCALAETWASRWLPELDSFRGIDALVVASPTATHVDWATRAIENGIPVLVEKPVSEDLSETDAIIALSDRYDVPISCALLERFNTAVRTAFDLVNEPVQFVSARYSAYASRITTGVAHDLLIHDVDLVLRLAGEMPDCVSAHFAHVHPHSAHGSEDVVEATLQFGDGLLAALSASRISQRKVRTIMISELECMIEVDLVRQDVTVYRHIHGDWFDGNTAGISQQTVIEIPTVHNAREPLASQLDHFVELASGTSDAAAERATLRPPHAVVARLVESANLALRESTA